MRKMRNLNTGTTINVVSHTMTRNMWEFYITDDKYNDDIVTALVMGYETELGDISLSEIKPHIISTAKNLNDLMPATGWEWVA